MERQRITERTSLGKSLAKASLASTGKTHRGKLSLGRPIKIDSVLVVEWKSLIMQVLGKLRSSSEFLDQLSNDT
jgi:hypothetical protein